MLNSLLLLKKNVMRSNCCLIGLGSTKIKPISTWKWYFVTNIVLTYCEKKNCFCDREKRLKFEAEGREFENFLRSLELRTTDTQ